MIGNVIQKQRRLKRSMLDLVYPPMCPLCDNQLPRAVSPPCLCVQCQEQVATPLEELCLRCGRNRVHTLDEGRCPACRNEQHRFERVIGLGPYAGALSEGIVRMKHAGQQSLTAALGRMLVDRIREIPETADLDVFVPIPMHWRRRILRGTGTSQVLAEVLAGHLPLPISPGLIKCSRGTRKQSTLSPTARRRNVQGAFFVPDPGSAKGLHVGLVDDTITTGATANEAAKVLRKAGVSRVTLIALARAVTNG